MKRTLKAERIRMLRRVQQRVRDPQQASFNQVTWRMILECGHEFVEDILQQTRKIEANGGMLTQDGSRRRTIGGVFLYLARTQMTPEQWKRVHSTTPIQVADAQATSPAPTQPETLAQVEIEAAPSPTPPQPEAALEAEPTPAPPPARSTAKPKPKQNGKHKIDPKARRASRFERPAPDVAEYLPPHVANQLQQLRGAANALRERVQQLEAQPSQSQAGLEMTRKLLAKTEGQIAALLAEHSVTQDGEAV